MDIINQIEGAIDIEKVGKYDKFINFTKVACSNNENIQSKDFKVEGVFFNVGSLNVEKVDPKECNLALKRMIVYIKKHISEEIDRELIKVRQKLEVKKYKKYELNKLIKKSMQVI